MELQFVVDADRCGRCGKCVRDCVARIIEQKNGGVPSIIEAEKDDCIECQHCLAVCPNGAISIFGLDPANSQRLTPEALPSLPQMALLVRGRRTVRQYQDENVDPALLADLLAVLANAPTGVNRRELTFNVIDDKAVMQRIREQMLAEVLSAADSGRLPEGAAYLRRMAAAYSEVGRDTLFRGAPHALIVSAPRNAPCPEQDVVLSLAYFELLAQSAGLGTVWWGMLKAMLEVLPDLKGLLGLPADHVYYGMLFGVPAVRYARTVQRDGAAVVRTIR